MDFATGFPLMKHTHSYTFSAHCRQKELRKDFLESHGRMLQNQLSCFLRFSNSGIVDNVTTAASTNANPTQPTDTPTAKE